jgi:hypothetical protein
MKHTPYESESPVLCKERKSDNIWFQHTICQNLLNKGILNFIHISLTDRLTDKL